VIFAARSLLVSLAFFGIVYCTMSVLVVLAWQGIRRMGRSSGANSANFLFGLRIFPFAVSLAVTLFFMLPSFWLLESASPDEDTATFVLALCSLLILTAGLLRLLRTQARTTRAVTQWSMGAAITGSHARRPSLSASSGAPPLILVGFRKPRVLLSDLATTVLSEDELYVAVRHELGHGRSWDNLKKMLISSTPFPGTDSLENAWQEAAELAADGAAVTNRQQALDLAAALIKLSRSAAQWPKALLVTGLLGPSSSIGLRVERLLQWRMAGPCFERIWLWTLLLFTVIIGIAANYGATLAITHRLTELLVP
jgi:beta-lactamase regulating signal transducer with metallopeptidase domain